MVRAKNYEIMSTIIEVRQKKVQTVASFLDTVYNDVTITSSLRIDLIILGKTFLFS